MKVTHIRKPVQLVNFKSKKHPTKKVNQKFHFKNRFLERVGYILSDEKYDEMCRLVKQDGVFIHKHEGSDQSVFGIVYDGMRLRVVYNPFTNILITILPNTKRENNL